MNLSHIRTWSELFDEQNRPELNAMLGHRDATKEILTRMGQLSAASQDEPNILRLLGILVIQAHWTDGEIKIVIRGGQRAGRCTVFLMRPSGTFSELIFKVDVNAIAQFFRSHIKFDPDLIFPLMVDETTTDHELVLMAPRVQSILPQAIVSSMNEGRIAIVPLPPPPIDLAPTPAPDSVPTTPLGKLKLKKLPPRPPRPPPPKLPASLRKDTTPPPSTDSVSTSVPTEEDVDDKWG